MSDLYRFALILVGVMLISGCATQNRSTALPTATPATETPAAVATSTSTALPPTEAPPSPTAPPTSTDPPPTPTDPPPSPTPLPPTPTPAPQTQLGQLSLTDRTVFRAGLINSEQSILAELPGASVYHIHLIISDTLTTMQGQETVLYTNREDVPLNAIYFRLFPNLAGGQSTVSNVRVDDQPIEPIYELSNSALRVPLTEPLPPGASTTISLDFAVEVPNGEGGNYGTFSFLENVLALAHVYPMIAVYDDEGWNVEIAPPIGDVVYADSSFYVVQVTAPASQTLVASGIEIARTETADQQIVTFAAGPVRDFYLASSADYQVVSRTVGDITVNSYAPANLRDGAEAALDQAVQALEVFNQRFGPYPFTEFDVVGTTTYALGIEYPGIVAILLDLYDQAGQVRGQATPGLMEGVVAHEVAHQWFYSLIGNDQVDEPWIDEALAQYATIVYYRHVYSEAEANAFSASLGRRWDAVERADIPIGLAVRDYSVAEYSGIIYGRGPLFVQHLAETMGPETFDAFLQDYYATYRWRIATGDDFKQLAEQHCNCDLTPLFETWVYPKTATK